MKILSLIIPAAIILAACSGKKNSSEKDLIAGEWLTPISIEPTQKEGFKLYPDGKAESVNMHTLLCRGWKMKGKDSITFTMESTGVANGSIQEISYKIEKLNKDSLILSQNDIEIWKMKREK